jgi:tRNA dimethylallyltransferase
VLQQLLEHTDAVAITGPTAGGKSLLAMQLAQALPLEIISMDSAQVYAGMDVGTAKPSAAERAAVTHHLIDIRDPAQSYNAAEFARDTHVLIAQIKARRRLPLIVGGTMLYFKALREGLADLPVADPQLRAQIDAQAAQLGWPAMHALLAQRDAATAARLAPHDKQRIGRALEIIKLTGKPMSALFETPPAQPLLRLVHVSVEPERALRWQRIEARFDAMLTQGLVDEVKNLRTRGDLHLGLPAMRCVGYRQIWEALDAGNSVATMRERAIAATRQLAKRQMTWLRSMPQRQVIHDVAGAMDGLAVALRST